MEKTKEKIKNENKKHDALIMKAGAALSMQAIAQDAMYAETIEDVELELLAIGADANRTHHMYMDAMQDIKDDYYVRHCLEDYDNLISAIDRALVALTDITKYATAVDDDTNAQVTDLENQMGDVADRILYLSREGRIEEVAKLEKRD